MKIEFDITYNTDNYQVLGEIGYENNREEIFFYLKAIAEATEYKTDYIHEKLLSKFPITTAKNILKELQSYLLVDLDDNLTQAGIDALKQKVIYEPSKGVFIFEVAENLPISSSIVNISMKKIRGQEAEVPKYLFADINRRIKLINGDVVKIISLEPTCQFEKGKSNITFQMEYTNKFWKVYLKKNNRRQKMDLHQKFSEYKIEEDILNHFTLATGLENTILVSADELSWEELSTFQSSRRVPQFSLPFVNKKVNVKISNINILPKNENEAMKWAEKLFMQKYLNDYCMQVDIDELWYEMLGDYDKLNIFNLQPPKVIDLLEIANQKQKWYLIAPLDFQLEMI